MATWLEKLRKIKENDTRIKRLQETMTHKTRAPIESLRGKDPLTDWALGVRERTLNPLATLAGEAKRFIELSPEEMGMELVGGGIAGTIGKAAKRLSNLAGDRAMSVAPKTEFELAHEVAQRNAALPVEQGGLGLPANNTAMDRAKAMGFDTPAYHGTNTEFNAFDPMADKASSHASAGDRSWFIDNPKLAHLFTPGFDVKDPYPVQHYGRASAGTKYLKVVGESLEKNGRIIPVLLNTKGADTINAGDASKMMFGRSRSDDFRDAGQEMADYLSDAQSVVKIKKSPVSRALELRANNYAINDPTLIRSRFAAFDPMQRNSSNILAGIGAGAVGLSSLAGLPQDDYY